MWLKKKTVVVFQQIAKTLGKEDWNVTDPCNNLGWKTPDDPNSNITITCNCTVGNDGACHIESMYVYATAFLQFFFFFLFLQLWGICIAKSRWKSKYFLLKKIHYFLFFHEKCYTLRPVFLELITNMPKMLWGEDWHPLPGVSSLLLHTAYYNTRCVTSLLCFFIFPTPNELGSIPSQLTVLPGKSR